MKSLLGKTKTKEVESSFNEDYAYYLSRTPAWNKIRAVKEEGDGKEKGGGWEVTPPRAEEDV